MASVLLAVLYRHFSLTLFFAGCLLASAASASSLISTSLSDPQILEPDDLYTQDLFGMDIEIDGDTAVISSKRFLYFYVRVNDSQWRLQSRLSAGLGSWFGDIEIEGDTLVAAKRYQTSVYRRNASGNWQLISDNLPRALRLALDGDRLMLAYFGEGPDGFTTIYKREADDSWTREFEVNHYGRIDLDGDIAVISTPAGVRIYTRSPLEGSWSDAVILNVDSYTPGDVSLLDNQLLIGYLGNYAANGFAYLYSRVGRGYWQLEHRFQGRVEAGPNQDRYVGYQGDQFGSLVELTPNKVVIGASQGYYSYLSGLLYVFERVSMDQWDESHVLLPAYSYDGFPAGVAFTDGALLAGAIYTAAESGAVYAYDISEVVSETCVDLDGDGWGWTGVSSCRADTPGSCDYTDASRYDGWGWDPVRGQSCPPYNGDVTDSDSTNSDQGHDTSQGHCDYSDAAQYGGWGWNAVSGESCPPCDTESCRVMPVPVCEDTDGDGWGWNAVTLESCRV